MHRDQVRARNAFQFVQGPIADREAFLGLARKLPVMLQTNGLLATWAHLLAKGSSEHREALAGLTGHLRSLGLTAQEGDGSPAMLFETWIDAEEGLSSIDLRRLTAEAIELAVWLKRAAEALCDTGAGGAAEPPAAGGEDVVP